MRVPPTTYSMSIRRWIVGICNSDSVLQAEGITGTYRQGQISEDAVYPFVVISAPSQVRAITSDGELAVAGVGSFTIRVVGKGVTYDDLEPAARRLVELFAERTEEPTNDGLVIKACRYVQDYDLPSDNPEYASLGATFRITIQ